jgi:outer membrane protein OmpA-like peptidoglycan-associated protein
MKTKLLFAIFAVLPLLGVAQNESNEPLRRVTTNGFSSNWFVSLGGSYNASYTTQEAGVSMSPFSHKRGSMGMRAALGKWFTPDIALRTVYDYGWAKNVTGALHGAHPAENFMYLHEDVMLNLTNMIWGYDENRIWTMSPYAGMGYLRNFDTKNNDVGINFGVYNDFKLTDRLSLFADMQLILASSDFLGKPGHINSSLLTMDRWDRVASVNVGVTYKMGRHRSWRNESNDLAQIVALNQEELEEMGDMLSSERQANKQLRREIARMRDAKPEEQPVKTATHVVEKMNWIATPTSVFFEFDTAKPESVRELYNLRALAEQAKQHHKGIGVTGYADSQTGSAVYNENLSKKRARMIVDELVKMGVPRENITLKVGGGVDELSPKAYNRRVVIELK